MISEELLNMIAMTKLKGVGEVLSRSMLIYFGSATETLNKSRALWEKVPGIGAHTAKQIKESRDEALHRAEEEMIFIDKNKIQTLCIRDDDYPKRLVRCQDAPLVLYFKGTVNLNASKIISIVGTRKITDYGRKLTETLINDLAELFPDTVIVSGLAYGVDVCAHSNSLKQHLPTVGVLAHGLDRLYPAVHRNIAVEMLSGGGGLLTDFTSGTTPKRENFLSRNRIIAGLADATIIVESDEKGGALVTANIAVSYGRDVYAFPGRVTDKCSSGCNRLIMMNKAGLINSARDLVMSLCWDVDSKVLQEQKTLQFKELPDHPVIRLLSEKGEFHINQLALELNKPVHKLTAILFELETEGHIKSMPGGMYQLA